MKFARFRWLDKGLSLFLGGNWRKLITIGSQGHWFSKCMHFTSVKCAYLRSRKSRVYAQVVFNFARSIDFRLKLSIFVVNYPPINLPNYSSNYFAFLSPKEIRNPLPFPLLLGQNFYFSYPTFTFCKIFISLIITVIINLFNPLIIHPTISKNLLQKNL